MYALTYRRSNWKPPLCKRLGQSVTVGAEHSLSVQRVLGRQRLQTKLKVGSPDDQYERQADRVAEQVTRDGNRREPLALVPNRVQRVCRECEEELQRKPRSGGKRAVAVAPCLSSLGAGQALARQTRHDFEPRFGADFGHVRVHRGVEAAAMAQSLRARAFTLGPDIVFGAGEYQPATRQGRALLAHELTHVVQQTGPLSGPSGVLQREQIGRVHDEATDPHFVYKLDADKDTFSELATYYGTSSSVIQTANAGTSPTTLRLGQSIKVPALHPPAVGSQPSGAGQSSVVQNTSDKPVDVRWSGGAGANRVGVINRGRSVFTFAGGVDVPLPSIDKQAMGIVNEMDQRNLLAGSMMLFAHITAAHLRSIAAKVAATDVDLIARMIWGEQRGQGEAAMEAAAWVARNRYAAGWGSYVQIITKGQFHGLVNAVDESALEPGDKAAWTLAKTIAQEVIDNIRADPTGGAPYFGNGAAMLTKMKNCAKRSSAFSYGNIAGTNFYYSNGDYTSSACKVP